MQAMTQGMPATIPSVETNDSSNVSESVSQSCIPLYSTRDTAAVAARLAAASNPGDVYYLVGDLGAGKTTFCQFFLQALGYKGTANSPTFTLLQSYQTPTLYVTHVDCYRIESAEEAIELDLFEASQKGVVLIEWPQKAEGYIPPARRTLEFGVENDMHYLKLDKVLPKNPEARPHRLPPRLPENLTELETIASDASFRRYYRAKQDGRPIILMYAPPPETTEDFKNIAQWLNENNFSAPNILLEDQFSDTMLLEDFGQHTFSKLLENEHSLKELNVSECSLYALAQQTLQSLWNCNAPNFLKKYDLNVLTEEVLLFPHWAGDNTMAEEWKAVWQEILQPVIAFDSVVLRDFHIDNMIFLPNRLGVKQCGLLDFQDALIGHKAYDMVSLYQDARRDVSIELEKKALAVFDDDFIKAYYTLGLQRHFKVMGIFHRLARRDNKRNYLCHIDRCWKLATRCLQQEPALQILLKEFSMLKEIKL